MMIFGYLMHREIGQSNAEENIKNVNGRVERGSVESRDINDDVEQVDGSIKF